jgi:chemotaxis protein CheD
VIEPDVTPPHVTPPDVTESTVQEIRVKVADYAVANGESVISTLGLGSCVAIMLYDGSSRIGGLAHILLPSEGLSLDSGNRAKFPSTAIPMLVEEMRKRGAWGRPMAKIVGGASMFASLLPSGGINMGERNVEATKRVLRLAEIPLVASDTGGEHGRSVYFHVSDGRVVVKSLKMGERVL